MGNQKQKKGNGVLPLVLGLALILLGAAVYLLPKATNALYEHKVQNQKEAFLAETPVVNPDGEAGEETEPALSPVLQELYDCLQKENERLFENHQDHLTDPFAYEQVAVDLSRYGLRDNIIGYITIEKMNVVLPILLGATVDNMRVGAVHLTETSYPIGGENTNCVLAAHRGASTQEMFRNIEVLEVGDRVIIENFKEELVYEVKETMVIDPSDVGSLLIQEGRDLVTLITCHPLGHNDHRYVVFCERVTKDEATG